jgi:transposase
VPVIELLKKRFHIRKVVLVCDRGMVSAKNLKAAEEAGFEYIVGMKMRNLVEVRDEVLGRAGRYHEVSENLRVKEVQVEERRYVVCFNPDEAAKDRADREATLAKIRAKLAKGGLKQLINNRGYKRYLRVDRGSAAIDEARAQEEERYDGKYVLRTNTSLPTDEVALAYRHLTWIERLWRDLKDVVELRPVFHWRNRENVKGHIFVCFLSLYLAALLKRKLAETNVEAQWDEIMRDLSALRAVTVELGDEEYLMRSPLQGVAGKVLAAVAIKPPPLAQLTKAA